MTGKCLTSPRRPRSSSVVAVAAARRSASRARSQRRPISAAQIRRRSSAAGGRRTRWPGADRRAARGTSVAHRPPLRSAYGQRGWNAQPGGRLIRLGGLPGIGTSRSRPLAGPAAASRPAGPRCRGAAGASKTSLGACRARPPGRAYITRTSSASSATTPRSWVMMMTAVPNSLCRSADQVEDLRLHGDVERGGRLVGDQQLRVADQRHRDHRALPHAAGELVRVVVDPLAAAAGCRPGRASRWPACAPPALLDARCAPGTPRRSAARPCRTGAAPTAGPGRSSPSSGRAAGAPSPSAQADQLLAVEPDLAGDRGRAAPLCRPMIARLVTLLPEPDSPTMPRVWPRSSGEGQPVDRLRTTPSSVGKCTCRSRTSRNGRGVVGRSRRRSRCSGRRGHSAAPAGR